MLCKFYWIVLYAVHFTAFSLGGRFFRTRCTVDDPVVQPHQVRYQVRYAYKATQNSDRRCYSHTACETDLMVHWTCTTHWILFQRHIHAVTWSERPWHCRWTGRHQWASCVHRTLPAVATAADRRQLSVEWQSTPHSIDMMYILKNHFSWLHQ